MAVVETELVKLSVGEDEGVPLATSEARGSRPRPRSPELPTENPPGMPVLRTVPLAMGMPT